MALQRQNATDRALRRRAPTVEMLRAAIDRGATGDKVAAFDPAAAPLGTDDKAAGTPPSPEQVALAYDYEVRRPIAPPRSRRRPSAGAVLAIVTTISFFLGLLWAALNS